VPHAGSRKMPTASIHLGAATPRRRLASASRRSLVAAL
jgi:hypothetical protein